MPAKRRGDREAVFYWTLALVGIGGTLYLLWLQYRQ